MFDMVFFFLSLFIFKIVSLRPRVSLFPSIATFIRPI